jgi:hypothetical protein
MPLPLTGAHGWVWLFGMKFSGGRLRCWRPEKSNLEFFILKLHANFPANFQQYTVSVWTRGWTRL